MRLRAAVIAFLLGLAAGCGGGGSAADSNDAPAVGSADINLLFMGNSHTSFNNLPGMVAAMVRVAQPGKSVAAVEAPNWMFLEQRASDAQSLALLRSGSWRYVVLQAQEYSSSGQFLYSIEGAVSLVGVAREVKAVPIMFPEWPRRGIPETQRIYDLHVSIAQRAPACVPPIPQSWDLAVARHPELVARLYDEDGNHSAPAGAFLAALIIATTMTGTAPNQLPFLQGFGVDADVQAKLRAVATDTVTALAPRQWCPQDPY
jgi:hypothetical protein